MQSQFYKSVAAILAEKLKINPGSLGFDKKPGGELVVIVRCETESICQELFQKLSEYSKEIASVVGNCCYWLILPPGADEPMEISVQTIIELDMPDESPEDYAMVGQEQGPAHLALIAAAKASNANKKSAWIITVDGTYLAYFPRDGATPIVDFKQQEGTKGMEALEPGLRKLCKHYFDLAIATNTPQEYTYTFDKDGWWHESRALVIPYLEYGQVLIETCRVRSAPLISRHYCDSPSESSDQL